MTKITIHNVETNEVIFREMNEEELAEWEQTKSQEQINIKIEIAKIAKRDAILVRLGLTEEEVLLLIS
jgi:hypothetical protein